MNTNINKSNVIKNIFNNHLYLTILIGSILIALLLPFSAQKYIVPSFYNQLINNTIDDAKKIGTHISRLQNYDLTTTLLYKDIEKLKKDFNLYKIRLYDEKGKIVFSTKGSEVGDINKNDYFFNTIAKGEIFYKVIKKGEEAFDGTSITKDVAEIYIPIMKDGVFKGSSEIYYDITDKKIKFETLISRVNFFYNIFAVLFILLSLIVIYVLSKNNLKELLVEQELQNKVDEKTKELQSINKNLEDKIKVEVEKNRERESQLFQQSKLASMGEMIGNIAHQWRQPLSAITSSASAVKLNNSLGLLDTVEIDEKMDGITTKAEFLSSTIENFRNFFKPNNIQTKFNLIEMIKRVENIVDSNYRSEYIELIHEYPENDIVVESLEGELSQVILNILNNSYDNFKEKNTQNRIVKISVFSENGKSHIKIYDNGGGIPQEILPKIFEPYFTTKHQSQGTGIGLYMCSDIIKKHLQGNLTASNEEFIYEDKKHFGACFHIEF